MDKILIFDFGSQTTQLIARRIREIGVYSEIVHGETPYSAELFKDVKGLIYSGSPSSVYDENSSKPDKKLYSIEIPILGICYGFHRMINDHKGRVLPLAKKEFGRAKVSFTAESPLFKDIPEGFTSWMSHGDSIAELAPGFTLIAESENHIAAAVHREKNFYGIQFHPEVTHCEYGNKILENFVCSICKSKKDWSMDRYFKEITADIKEKVKEQPVLLLISGGVDSCVVGGILLKALKSDQVHLMYINTGLMRKNESKEIEKTLKGFGAKNLYLIDASEIFLSSLKGVCDPEKKREIIGDLFIKVQETEISKRLKHNYFLAQGTLYTDMIESGKGVGKNANVIKSHHNVRSPLIEAKRAKGLVIEPLKKLYKDEVRSLGRSIGLSAEIIDRHPFPGPGLAVRIIGDITEEKCSILREADYLFIKELKKRSLYNHIWQAFCVLLPVRSVGVTGDSRDYGYVLALRAIISKDGMTADVFPFDMKDILEISSLITNSVAHIGRVVYDISSKPPATIEWE